MIKFNQFQSSSTVATTDQLVGYANTSFGGERRWSIGTILSSIITVPTGAVMYFASTSVPTGWEACNGATISNTGSYVALYAFLASAGWPFGGVGKIPDLRGKFIRSNGTDGTYSSGSFGATQADQFKSHSHTYSKIGLITNGERDNNQQAGDTYTSENTSAVGGTETRPANVALLACIKL